MISYNFKIIVIELVVSEQNRHIKNPDSEGTGGKKESGGKLHRETCAGRRKTFA